MHNRNNKRRRKKKIEKKLLKLMAQTFPKLMTVFNFKEQIQGTQRTPSRINAKHIYT